MNSLPNLNAVEQLASCLIYSYALIEYIIDVVVDGMSNFFLTMILSVKFAEEKVLVFLIQIILRDKC